MGVSGVRRTAARAAVRLAALLAAVAVGAAVWFGGSWALAASDDGLDLADQRDLVVRDAGQAAVNLTTFDPANVQQSLLLWEQSAGGELLARLTAARGGASPVQPRTRSKVADAAVSQLDAEAGTATALVALSVVVIGADDVEQRGPLQRLVLDLERTDTGWKATSLDSAAPTS